MSDPILSKLDRAKTDLVLHHPFFAVIALSLPMIEENSPWNKTMATDGFAFYWNRSFVESLDVMELAGVIMHEVLHVVWLHMLRRGNRDPKLWNFAGDYAINLVILDTKAKLPTKVGGKKFSFLYDEKYRDWSVFKIYDDLLKNAKKIKIGISLPDSKPGDSEGKEEVWGVVIDAKSADGKPLSESERAEIEEEVKIKIQSAVAQAKAIGKLPAGLEGLVKAVAAPKVNWQDYIQQWVKGHVPDDYTWRRPNRKWMTGYDIYMPRTQLNGAGVGVLSIDTSGSVSDEELHWYINEITGVIDMCKPDALYIVQHDSVIQKIDRWEHGMDFSELHIKGRGGTCIMPTFKQLDNFDEQIDWLICFTDMGIGDYPTGADIPDIPVLWCATGPKNVEFGTYIDLRRAM